MPTYDAILLSRLWVAVDLRLRPASRLTDGTAPERRGGPAMGAGWSCSASWPAARRDTKFTGWFLPLPFLAWTGLYRNRPGSHRLWAVGWSPRRVLYLLNPPWWSDPIGGVDAVPALEPGPRPRRSHPDPVSRQGLSTTPDGSLPWYNTLVWTVFVTPVGFLALALGLASAVDPSVGSSPRARWSPDTGRFLLILRALPHTPGHDGVRQFLPGVRHAGPARRTRRGALVDRFGRGASAGDRRVAGGGAVSVALMMPVPLSYYSPIVGRLARRNGARDGADLLWDALTEEPGVASRAHAARADGSIPPQTHSWLYLRDVGELPPALFRSRPGAVELVRRSEPPGGFSPDRAARRARPARVHRPEAGRPLVWIFPYDQVVSVLRP